MREEITGDFEILSDGRSVWVNSASGMCVGRFRPGAMDVHHDAQAQMAGEHCLDCAHGAEATWAAFKAAMRTHYGLDIPDTHAPLGSLDA